MTWLWDALRFIEMKLTWLVFWFVEQLLQAIVDLANAPLFSDTIIDIFSRRIYVILGLVMVFKLMISFIQILIDPDAMSDKEKGVGNILKRVVISMALIVLVPSIFKMARDVQGYILPIIPKVVLGIQSDQNIDDPVSSSNVGSVMAWYSFLPFFDYQNEACNDGSIQKLVSDDTSTYEIYSVGTAVDNINTKDSCSTDSSKYKYEFKFIGIIVGAYLLFAFVQVAIQIAIRTIKFGLCELVAPIPIASYIDPKTSKSTFDKWIHTSIKVYLDLFIQLIAIYFVVFVFQTFVSNIGTMGAILQNVGNDMWRASLVILFIIIGLTQFIKQFPKFLSDMLGISTDGELGKILKPSKEWLTGGALGSTAAGLAGMAHAGLSARNYSKLKGENGFRQTGRTVGAMFRTGAGSLKAVADGKGVKETYGISDNVHKGTIRRVNTTKLRKDDKQRYLNSGSEELLEARRAIQQQIELHQEAYQNATTDEERRHQQEQIKNWKRAEKQNERELEAWRKDNDIPLPAGSMRVKIKDAWNNFSGRPLPNSSTYHEAASFMNQGKAIFNEAKAKITEKPTLIQDELDTINFSAGSIEHATFSDVFQAYKDMTEGREFSDARFHGITRSELETIYGDALKDTAARYVDRVETGDIINDNMLEKIKRWDSQFSNEIIISDSDRKTVSDKITETLDGKKQHGSLFKGADNIGEKFETISSNLKATEEAKKGSSQ